MLGDGIIPSNVKGGYLSRLVIRRTLRLMKELGLRLPLADLVQLQISRLDYPDWEESFATIREILDQEEQKYAETLEKGMRLVRKTAESYLKKKEPVPRHPSGDRPRGSGTDGGSGGPAGQLLFIGREKAHPSGAGGGEKPPHTGQDGAAIL
jgi:hypothetical protein